MKKIKITWLLPACLLFSNYFYGQAFGDGKNLVSFGFGLPPTSLIPETYNQNNSLITYAFNNYGTIVLKFEHGVQQYFSLGLNLEYSGSSVKYQYTDGINTYDATGNSSQFGLFGRINGHYPIGEQLDLYGGFGLGYSYIVDNTNNPNTNVFGQNILLQKATFFNFDYQVTIGARYMIKPHVGLFLELGHATTNAQLGLVLGI